MNDVEGLVERLTKLGQRREMEGIYTDQNICETAASALQAQAAEIERLTRSSNGWEADAMIYAKNADYWEDELRKADAVIMRLNSGAELQAITAAHNDTLAKLREAVGIIERLANGGIVVIGQYRAEARAFLATMEKTDG